MNCNYFLVGTKVYTQPRVVISTQFFLLTFEQMFFLLTEYLFCCGALNLLMTKFLCGSCTLHMLILHV